MRLFCLCLVSVMLFTVFSHSARAGDAAPNILVVLTDDQRWDTIAALGNPEIQTPVTDRLVERGFHFTNAYCMGSMVGAVCLPSRTMILTGRSLWRIPDNPRAKEAPPGVPLLPTLLKEAGYTTFRCGKAGNSCTFANAAFETDISTQDRDAQSSTRHVQAAIDFVENHDSTKPFFLYLAPPVPHDPRVAPPRFHALYNPDRITLSANFMPRHPFDNGALKIRDELLADFPRDPEQMRQHLADYYASISNFDFELGRLLETLKTKGVLKNTVVIFSSDQGLAVGGRHGLMGKQNLYEHVKPPLVFTGPGIPEGKSDALVYLFDLFPTICDLAGASVPEVVEGKSLMPIIRGQASQVRDSLLGAYSTSQRMVRDERWKLMAYNAGSSRNVQLFDLKTDPDETRNLAGDPAFAAERKRLEALLKQQREHFGDPVDFR